MLFNVVKLFFVLATFKVSEACNGYSFKLDHAKACSDDSITVPTNFDIILDKSCNLVISGCIDVLKPVKNAKGTYEVTKSPMPTMSGDVDICDIATKGKMSQSQQVLNSFGLPKKCPVAAKKYCTNGKKNVSIASYKNQLAMALGTVRVKLNVEHDTGNSCVDMQMTITKKK